MKKLTKIDKQRIEFLNSIDFSDWKQNHEKIPDFYRNTPYTFKRYHEVMFSFYTRKSDEEFVKYWWFGVIHPNLQKDIPLTETKVNQQNAVFAIDYTNAAFRIVSKMSDKMESVFCAIEDKIKYK